MEIPNLEELKAFTKELAQASGELIMRYWNADSYEIERKADTTPVTEADHEAERLMRAMIKERYPEHGIIAEEFGNENEDADFVWVLDPIDGTKSFVGHVPLFGTLIGMLYKNEPAIGCIHQPVLGELVIGDNKTTTLNDKPVKIRPCDELKEALLLTTDPIYFTPERELHGLAALSQKVYLNRAWGDCYGYLLVASGKADLMLDPEMAPWDILPVIPVIRGAGGIITDWQGNPATVGTTSALAAPAEIHAAALEILKSKPNRHAHNRGV